MTFSYSTPHFRVCDDILARVGTNPTVRSCRPMAVTDAPVVLALLLVVGFILPDIRKISIGGLVELERQVQDQQRQTEQLAAKIDMLTISASSARASVSIRGLPPVGDEVLPPGVTIDVDEATLAEKEQILEQELSDRDEQ